MPRRWATSPCTFRPGNRELRRRAQARHTLASPRLILASASPRRRELLHAAGYEFEVHPPDVDEDKQPPQILPADLAQRLAQLKAYTVAERFPNDIVLAADTVVAFGDRALGKPANDTAAVKMLELLSGTTHIVITGVVIMHKAAGITRSARVMSAVRMKMLSSDEIRRYVEGGQWQGKAGGYGIQDERDAFVTCIAGSHSNVVGLPMEKATELLAGVGIVPTQVKSESAADSSDQTRGKGDKETRGEDDSLAAPPVPMSPPPPVPLSPQNESETKRLSPPAWDTLL